MGEIIEIRWHGRGGQGAVTSAELLALAAIEEGKYAQAMPSFGPERRGAPVLAYNRVSFTKAIKTREPVSSPDIVIVLEPNLLDVVDVTFGLKEGGIIVVNTSKNIENIIDYFNGEWKLAAVDASGIAKQTIGVPIANTAMLGALIKATEIIKLESLERPLKERFGARAASNMEACRKSFKETVIGRTYKKTNSSVSKSADKLISWKDILPGAVIVEAGNAKSYRTGDWRSSSPVYDYNKCNRCGLCFIYCPEGCIRPLENGYFEANMYYCKGCGICAKECPKSAITMINN